MFATLDDATADFLKNLRAAGAPPMDERPLADLRAGIRAASQQLGPRREEMHTVEDRRIPTTGGEIAIRIYTPRQTTDPLPIALFFHGGGFVAGDLDSHDSVARYHARHGDAIVIAVEYRLAPESRFPAQVDDAWAALTWAAAQARAIGGDPNRIAVIGDSAGGNLAAVLTHTARDRGGPRIAFQALVYPQVDLDLEKDSASRLQFGGGEFFLSRRDMAWFRAQYLTDVPGQMRDPRVSPLAQPDLSGLPPAVVITAGCDPLHDEGHAYADALVRAGVPVDYRCFDGTIHAFVSFAGAIPLGMEGLAFVASRLRSGLA
jgi:acetyl esterase